MAEGKGKTAVFLLNMGGPDSVEAVEPFLRNLFSDPEIMSFPLAFLFRRKIAGMISKKRAARVSEHYRAMGGKSPMLEITDNQAEALQKKLGPDYTVHVAMRYWRPFADEAAAAAKAAGAERIVILPLYPHYCRATSGSSIKDMERAIYKAGMDKLPRRVIEAWDVFPPYIEALTECVHESIKDNPDTTVLWSAHGLPVSIIEKGDPYLDQIQSTVGAVMKNFEGISHTLAFQSRTGPVKWLEPYTDNAIKRLASEGVKDVTVVAVSFVSDHIETLIEIDVEYKELAESLGIEHFRRAPSLNTRESFINALHALVIEEE